MTGRSARVVLAAGLLFLVVGAAPAGAAPLEALPAETAVEVVGGHLEWGVKESFRSYVTGPIAKGWINTDGGASANTDGTYRFPVGTGGVFDDAAGLIEATTAGSVRFRGHRTPHPDGDPQLDLTISELRLEALGPQGVLVADVATRTLEGDVGDPVPGGEPIVHDDVALVALDLAAVTPVRDGDTTARWSAIPAVITDEGAEAFGDFYLAGTPMDPVTLVLDLSELPPGVVDPPPVDPLADIVMLDRYDVAVGETLTASGTGFVGGEQVQVFINSTPTWAKTTVAGSAGQVVVGFAVPDVPPGSHRVELRGVSSGRSILSDWLTVRTSVSPPFQTGPGTAGTLPATGTELHLALTGLALVLVGSVLVRLAHASADNVGSRSTSVLQR